MAIIRNLEEMLKEIESMGIGSIEKLDLSQKAREVAKNNFWDNSKTLKTLKEETRTLEEILKEIENRDIGSIEKLKLSQEAINTDKDKENLSDEDACAYAMQPFVNLLIIGLPYYQDYSDDD